MLRRPCKLKLQVIDGTPGKEEVTFLYSAEAPGALRDFGDTWLEADALLPLSPK